IADVDSLDNEDNAITLMTIHSAKGLEFDTVFIIGLEEGLLPHSQSLLERDELEEERRLMYVAMTRAKQQLFLLRAKSRMLYGEVQSSAPSQFLVEIPPEIVQGDTEPERDHQTIDTQELGYTPIPYEEYDQEGVTLNGGDRVSHTSFGEGVVQEVTGGVATIKFNNPRYGTKKLALSIAPLKKID
ncbi:MAG TPA: 3'-5' exonuclease, partial [Candidatus Gracilibacteria bacterium]|nr:3'-5' exonuclease [Candidatus Gracilibacteria bacterium]